MSGRSTAVAIGQTFVLAIGGIDLSQGPSSD
jgi:ribose/xylose/arabinose/galactoside ABC-type transport system permease subunit